MSRSSLPTLATVIAAHALLLAGCGSDDEPKSPTDTASCAEDRKVGGSCAGVPAGDVCADAVCTAGATCSEIFDVANDAEYQSAADRATSGSCIALRVGNFGRLRVPGGVSLLGQGAERVTVAGLDLDAGSGSLVRGLSVVGSMKIAAGSLDVRLDRVRVEASTESGIDVGAGSTVSITQSEVLDAALYGISAFDAGSLDVRETLVAGSRGPGLWAQCATGCDCVAAPDVSVTASIIRDNKTVGIALAGVAATLEGVDVSDHTEGSDFRPGGGVAAFACASMSASGLRVLDNSSYGVLVDSASGSLGGPDDEDAVEVAGNYTGIWINGSSDFRMEGLTVADNHGVGMGVTGGSRGIICWRSAISNTQATVVPVMDNGSAGSDEVGDGLAWLEGSQLEVDGLTLANNARASMLIDGPAGAGSSVSNVTLSGGDENLGLVQQNAPVGTETPMLGANSPSIQLNDGQMFSVPLGPMAPAL